MFYLNFNNNKNDIIALHICKTLIRKILGKKSSFYVLYLDMYMVVFNEETGLYDMVDTLHICLY